MNTPSIPSGIFPFLMKMAHRLCIIMLSLSAAAHAQNPTIGSVLPHTSISSGTKLRVAVPETVSEVVLESRRKGSTGWTPLKTAFRNPAGSTQIVLEVPKTIRNRELRVTVRSLRPAPQTVEFTVDKAKSRLRVKAGLAGGTKVSVEFFDKAKKQWKRFATAAAPKDKTKAWNIPVPKGRLAASLRITRLDSKTPGSQSARFPAAFRTGKTKFAGREIPYTPTEDVTLGSTALDSSAGKAGSDSKSAIEESDIWKISGTRIFFFNQHRGLQVIETSNPADPEIVSSLRMPAVGEDMYLLPNSRALLVRRDWMNGGTTGVVLVDTVKPQARILAELDVPGWYVDSRLVDGRLVLATSEWNTQTWKSSTRVSVVDGLGGAPKVASSESLDFQASALGTGAGRLWVAGSKNWNWDRSTLAVFPLAALPVLGKPLEIELGGAIYDKFKIHIEGDSLFAVTQSWGTNWRQSTAIESHSLSKTSSRLLQKLPLVVGESLHATRFDAGRAYIVTFEQIDPLWIVDLSDPAAMRIESELEVPGWSTYIQPVGRFLAAVGVENGKVTASLFDVRDPAKPFLSSRVEIGDGNSWSEANWNEKAVAILPESGLILLPYSSFDSEGHVTAVQLVDMNAATGSLVKRGVVRHAFTPRRASALREGILASISNRELFLLDARNRDKPALLSDTALAFGTDRILGSRNSLLVHAESGDWSGSAAVLRVSQLADPDDVIAQASLGEGALIAADMRGRHIVALLRGRSNPGEGRLVRFDAEQLPALVETGRSTFKISSGWNPQVDLLWPADDLAVAALRWSEWSWWRGPWDYLQTTDIAAVSRKSVALDIGIWPQYRLGVQSAVLQAFDLTSTVPKAASTLDLASIKPRNLSPFFAVDGLVVFSADQAIDEVLPAGADTPTPRTLDHARLRIVDYADAASPFYWPAVALPGRLESIADFDRSAGLLFTSNSDGSLQALFLEGGAAHSVASLNVQGLRTLSGRSVWNFADGTLTRHRLSDEAKFVPEGARKDLPFAPQAVRAWKGGVLAQSGQNLFDASNDFNSPLRSLKIAGWGWWWNFELSSAHVGDDGSISAPAGEYGIELLK